MEEKIVKYLKEKYQPTGIILTGSRVNNNAPIRSDWDIVIFTDVDENTVDDYAELKEFMGEALEISPNPAIVPDDFVLMTAMHPVRDIKVLYDNSDGLMQKIVANTKQAYALKPKLLTNRKKDLYRKILNKFIRKVESRPDNLGYVFFGLGQFHHFAIRYWFEVRQEWPLPIYQAVDYIDSHDQSFFKHISILHSPDESNKHKLEAAKAIRDILFPLS